MRAGYQLTTLNDNMDGASSLHFAVGLKTGAINNLQVFKLSVGAEGLPTEGAHGATLSLVGNWSALTGALSSH